MREINYTSSFRRDVRREKKGRHAKALQQNLLPVLESLAQDKPLAPHYRDHALSGNWSGLRDCHIKPDLVLIYQKPDDTRLILLRLGSHSELKI